MAGSTTVAATVRGGLVAVTHLSVSSLVNTTFFSLQLLAASEGTRAQRGEVICPSSH